MKLLIKSKLRRSVATLLSAALILLSPGLGAYEAFAQVAVRSASGQTAVSVVPSGLGSGVSTSQSALSSNGIPLSLTLATLPQLSANTPTVSLQGSLSAEAKVGAEKVILEKDSRMVVAVPNPVSSSWVAVQRLQETRVAGSLTGLQTGQEQVATILAGKAPDEEASSTASSLFEGLRNETKGEVAVEARDSGVKAADLPGRGRSGRLSRAGVKVAVGLAAVLAFGAKSASIGTPDSSPVWSQVLNALGVAGYWIGNGLAFVFAVPQIHKTLRIGDRGPIGRAVIGMAVSLALGLISAPVAGQLFWGLQNVFSGLTMIAPFFVSKLLTPRGKRYSAREAWGMTALICAVALGASWGLYAAAAAVVPALLTAALGKAGVANLTLALQVATGVGFFALFAPDLVATLHKKAPAGFTSLVSLSFALASFGFVTWAVQAAVVAAGSAERLQFGIYAIQNAIYALVGLLSYFFSRKHEKKA